MAISEDPDVLLVLSTDSLYFINYYTVARGPVLAVGQTHSRALLACAAWIYLADECCFDGWTGRLVAPLVLAHRSEQTVTPQQVKLSLVPGQDPSQGCRASARGE